MTTSMKSYDPDQIVMYLNNYLNNLYCDFFQDANSWIYHELFTDVDTNHVRILVINFPECVCTICIINNHHDDKFGYVYNYLFHMSNSSNQKLNDYLLSIRSCKYTQSHENTSKPLNRYYTLDIILEILETINLFYVSIKKCTK